MNQNNSSDLSWLENKIINYYKKNQNLPEYYNAWNDKQIIDFSPTLTVKCGNPCSRTGVLIIEKITQSKKFKADI